MLLPVVQDPAYLSRVAVTHSLPRPADWRFLPSDDVLPGIYRCGRALPQTLNNTLLTVRLTNGTFFAPGLRLLTRTLLPCHPVIYIVIPVCCGRTPQTATTQPRTTTVTGFAVRTPTYHIFAVG